MELGANTAYMFETVEAVLKISGTNARLGNLLGASTPLLLGSSSSECLPHMLSDSNNPDFENISTSPVSVALDDVILESRQMKHNFRGIRKYYGLNASTLIFLVPTQVGTFRCTPSSDRGVSLDTAHGRLQIETSDFQLVAKAAKPDISLALNDNVSAHVSKIRNEKSVSRTLGWLTSLLKREPEFPGFIFGSIEGTNDLHLRKLSALQTAALPVDGFVISGICSGESSEERDNILSTILPLLPDEKCRAISSVTSPLDILNAIHHGVDVIQSDYATVLSNLCYASVFSIPNSRSGLVSSATRNIEDWRPKFCPCGTQVAAPSKLNLRDKQFERDQLPLLIGCTCYTCKHYMRAYLHHLLNVRELLGNTLLHIHNLHHLNKLVECTRESIYYGSFLVFWKEFKRSFQGGFQ